MMNVQTKRATSVAILFLVIASVFTAQVVTPRVARAGQTPAIVSQASVRKHMEALAGDEMRGRGRAPAEGLLPAKYIAPQLKLLNMDAARGKGRGIGSRLPLWGA